MTSNSTVATTNHKSDALRHEQTRRNARRRFEMTKHVQRRRSARSAR